MNDRRIDKELNAIRESLLSISAKASVLAKHLPDAQSVAWDEHPETNAESTFDPAEHPPGTPKRPPPKSTKARNALRALRDNQTGIPALEAQLMRMAGNVLKLFSGPGSDTTLRGTLLGWNDPKTGEFVPHSPSLEMKRALEAQQRRETRAPRTGETTHERLEQQQTAPREPGIDPNLRRDRAS